MKISHMHLPRRAVAVAATATLLASAAAAALGCGAEAPLATATASAAETMSGHFNWMPVVTNGDFFPGTTQRFNSYNQPSVNSSGRVVFRARSKGGASGRQSGVYARQMPEGEIETIANLGTPVPEPNDTVEAFIEFPSIPRIAINTDALATRGNHRPVWTLEGDERVGTTGVYVRLEPGGALLAGASKLGAVPEYAYFAVPGAATGTFFDVFPGAPAIADDGTIVFKGNYTENGIAKTGVYYRVLESAGTYGQSPVRLIADSDTEIPFLPTGVSKRFGSFDSTSPPSAAAGTAVFVGLDYEDAPSYGGIYGAQLKAPKKPGKPPELNLLVGIGSTVPGTNNRGFTRVGEGLSWDGRYLAFWGAWGQSTKTVRLYCPTEGNKLRRAFCNSAESGSTYDPATGRWFQERQVPINQGIFVRDTVTGRTRIVARTNSDFDDFVYWNFSGRVAGSEEGDDGEPARWRSATFIAVSSGAVAFKARTGSIDATTHVYATAVDGIYLQRGADALLETVADTTMDGGALDPLNAVDLPITELGLERDGFRGDNLVIVARMGVEEGEEGESWAGIYLTRVAR